MNLWKHVTSANVMAFDSLISTVLADFVKMYRQHSKGKEKYTRLLLGWYTYMKQYVVHETVRYTGQLRRRGSLEQVNQRI